MVRLRNNGRVEVTQTPLNGSAKQKSGDFNALIGFISLLPRVLRFLPFQHTNHFFGSAPLAALRSFK